MATSTELGVVNDIDLATIPPADAAAVSSPNPADVSAITVDNKLTVTDVLNVPVNITYTPIATTDEVNNETLNRTAETMAADLNTKFQQFQASLSASFADLNQDGVDQAAEIQAKFSALTGAVNAGFADIRTKSGIQADDIMGVITSKVGSVMTEMQRVLDIAENSQVKIASLDDTYNTDSEFAARVAAVNALIDQMTGTDLNFFEALDSALDELNTMVRFRTKVVTVNSVNGIYSFDMAGEAWAPYGSAADYHVETMIELDDTKQTSVATKTGTGFTISIKSKGVHYKDQVVDCSSEPVPVHVRLSQDAVPLSFTATRLNDSAGSTTTGALGN